jgi:hypothetical protein
LENKLSAQIKQKTKIVFGNSSIDQTIDKSTFNYDGTTEEAKYKATSFVLNPGIGVCIYDNLIIGGSIKSSFQKYQQLEPISSDSKTTSNGNGGNVFFRYIIPIPFQVKPSIQLGAGKIWYSDKFFDNTSIVESYKYNVRSISVSPALNIFNKDQSRSFDIGVNINFNKYSEESTYSENYGSNGLFLGYTIYLK